MRHRTHLLEEESLLELKKNLPKEWVVREKPKDYGIDVEIEIFNSKGGYTGLVFWIQLKGTDSSKNKDHISLRMPISKINQLSSYELPVALFRYNSINKEFYFEWIVRYRFLSASSKNKTFNITFDNHHMWSQNSTNHIISYLKRREQFNKGTFSFPIRGFVNDIEVENKASRKLSASISKESSLIKIVRDRYSADIEINLINNRIVLNVSGAYGSSIGFRNEDIDNDDLIYNAFKKAFLLVLAQTEKETDLFNFIKENKLLEEIINHPSMLQYLLPKLLTGDINNQFTEEIVDSVFKSGNPITQTTIQAIISLSSKNAISHERIKSYFRQVIKLSSESEDINLLAPTYYNFGNYYRGVNVLDEAFKYYNKAYKIDATYLERGYFCRELAGILFDLDFYTLSAQFYQKARYLESDNIFLIGTLADAEMYSGNYEKALKLFDEFLIKNIKEKHDKYEFCLKFSILKAIVESFDIKRQKRNVNLLSSTFKSLSKEELKDEDKLYELLQIDVLNPYVWGQYSLIALREDNLFLHFLASMIQAVLVKSDTRMWAYLTILATNDENLGKSIYDIANTAYFYCREDYFSMLEEMITMKNNHDLKGKDFVSYIESLVHDPKEYPLELRLWLGDEVKIFKL